MTLFGKKKISVCYIDSSNLGSSVMKATQMLNDEFDDAFDMRVIPLYSIAAPETREQQLDAIEHADLVLVDIRGTNPLIKDILEATRRGKATVASLLGGSIELMSLTKMGIFDAHKFFNGPRAKNMSGGFANVTGETNFDDIDNMLKEKLPGFVYKDIGAWFEVTRFWGINGVENIRRMMLFFGKKYCKLRRLPDPLPPLKQPSPAIRHPHMETLYTDLREYLEDYGYDESKPTAVLVYYDGMHYENCIVPTTALVDRLEPEYNVVPIACDGMKNINAIRSLAFLDGTFIGDVLLHIVWFRLNGGPIGGREELTYELYREIDVPVYHPVTVFTDTVERWEAENKGLNPSDYLANIVLPECDGAIEPLLLCGGDATEDPTCRSIISIDDRVDRYVGRIKKAMALSAMENRDKRVCLILYNYPPGEHNLGNAAYLDSFASIRNILLRMKKKGYTVGDVPDDLAKVFLENNIVNSPRWHSGADGVSVTAEEYEKLLAPFPALKQDIEAYWGPFPGPVNADSSGVRLPMLKLGNVLVALQPSRGFHEEDDKSYHDKTIPPHHQYAAFYTWLQRETDAIVHVGTHGTLEFLRGKEMTPSARDDMDMLLGDLPHFYIYQTGNPSEAMIAKRRAMATLISYSTPAADAAGLYGEYLAMRDLFAEREESDKLGPQRAGDIEETIRQKALEQGWDDLDGDIEKIAERLTTLSRAMIPVGLHEFGIPMDIEEQERFLAQCLRLDRGELKSLNRVLAEKDGLSYDELLEKESLKLEEYDKKARELIGGWLKGEESEPDTAAQRDYALSIAKKLQTDPELDGLLHAMDIKWAGAGLSADAIRNPEVLPSGRNLYQFDPLILPTPAAVERGRQIARNTLELYKEENGVYPKSVGVVLWGFETAKTCGETVGQVLEYLGVKVATSAGSWFPQVEVIPREEMSHPRIDVMVEICGFFRDMFPNLISMIDDAVRAVSRVEEEDNAVRAGSLRVRQALQEDGVSEADAAILADLRIFGPAESEYGTSLTTMIETTAWDREEELGDAFHRDMCHAYGRDFHGQVHAAVNSTLLSGVEMISQIQDTYEYEVTDLDHYYEFFGGFSSAVLGARGKRPKMLTTNTSTEKIRTEDVSAAISRGTASRTLNPKWIDAMLEHEYHGAQHIADRVQYLIGLEATTGSVSQTIWENTANTFLFDPEMLERLRENNRYAADEIAQRMYESTRRGYWEASEEELQKLLDILKDSEELLEGAGLNE